MQTGLLNCGKGAARLPGCPGKAAHPIYLRGYYLLRFADTNIVTFEYISTLPDGLEVKLIYTEYRDYPVKEWVAAFTNRGTADSKILQGARLGCHIDGSFESFTHGTGDTCHTDGYFWTTDPVDTPMEIAPVDGTSCNGASPFMKLQFADFTLRIGIGWSGMWSAAVSKDAWGVHYTVGQKRCHMLLRPGETMRTPALTVMVHTGDQTRGMNLWRRWYLAHILPKEFGEGLQPYACLHNWCSEGKPEFTAASEKNQLEALQAYIDNGMKPDIWWIDAGWYTCDFDWPRTGTWEPDPERFPHGLTPIGEACEKQGIRFLLWFEPERVNTGSWLHEVHPEWMLNLMEQPDGSHHDHHLLDLSQDAACDWCIEHIDAMIKRDHISIYRQDFNFAPLSVWEHYEAPDRIGAMENRHIQNYLRFWDELILRNPGLWIDSCASGGRRNDLDTLRRAVPLHYTDVGYGIHPTKQLQHRTLFEWAPYFRAHPMNWDGADGSYTVVGNATLPLDEFAFQNAMAPAMTSMVNYQDTPEMFALNRKMEPQWREAAQLMMTGDYYPLTECRQNALDWYAMQFDDSDTGTGFINVIRNNAAPAESLTIALHALPEKNYTFTNRLTGESFVKTGRELCDGLEIALPLRTGVTLFYTAE